MGFGFVSVGGRVTYKRGITGCLNSASQLELPLMKPEGFWDQFSYSGRSVSRSAMLDQTAKLPIRDVKLPDTAPGTLHCAG